METGVRARTAGLLGIAILAAAAAFGSPSLYPAGVALVVIPLIAAIWVGLASLRLRILRFAPRGPLIEGRPNPLELHLEPGLVPPPGGEIHEPLLEAPLGVTPRSRRWLTEVEFPRRGRKMLGSAEIVVRDPFGLCRRRLRTADAGELIVLPRIEPLEFSATAAGRRALGLGEHGAGGGGPDSWAAEFEIDGLRPYREGSPASRIHWPTVARTGELHERRITAGADAARLVIVDPRAPASETALDAAVRAAASICLEFSNGPGCSLLIGGEPRPVDLTASGRAFSEVHHRLALLAPDAGAPALGRIGRAGIVIWISADLSHSPEREIRRVPATRRILVRPLVDPRGTRTLFRVAACEAVEVAASWRRGIRDRLVA